MAEPAGHGSPWYSHPLYARYWSHYQQAAHWQHKHWQAYRKALEAAYCVPYRAEGAAVARRHSSGSERESAGPEACPRFPSGGKRGPSASRRAAGTKRVRCSRDGEENSSSDGEVECDVSNMEITEELRQYFAETERHREERRKQQQLEEEQQSAYVPADHDLYRVARRSAQPPRDQPGVRRGIEMKMLYGEDAAKIQGMETAMQLTFDRNCDLKQPKYWPVIPLKL
uniref:Gem (nuclear organelle) associated protein 8 n=1 Tax=Lepisosteus oculatus TaxID=7918 RepID=W5MV88_LEPOC|nr:PREDICTED: gem-associated protein 8 [Lepisosteus oculatus]XP_015217243.1 PREDICTED: gem-associated protein 8 [Lepisosteus oculatus]XP_015217244.1 PREDICTED: gem-associated protein 8 [Lepisosteus oculatus]